MLKITWCWVLPCPLCFPAEELNCHFLSASWPRREIESKLNRILFTLKQSHKMTLLPMQKKKENLGRGFLKWMQSNCNIFQHYFNSTCRLTPPLLLLLTWMHPASTPDVPYHTVTQWNKMTLYCAQLLFNNYNIKGFLRAKWYRAENGIKGKMAQENGGDKMKGKKMQGVTKANSKRHGDYVVPFCKCRASHRAFLFQTPFWGRAVLLCIVIRAWKEQKYLLMRCDLPGRRNRAAFTVYRWEFDPLQCKAKQLFSTPSPFKNPAGGCKRDWPRRPELSYCSWFSHCWHHWCCTRKSRSSW